MIDNRDAVQALKEISIALQAVHTARDKIILVRDGYDFDIPTNADRYLFHVAEWLRETERGLEEHIGKWNID